MPNSSLPDEGFLRLNQIIGDANHQAIIPVSRSTWLRGVAEGRFPKPVKLGSRTVAWTAKDIKALIDEIYKSSEPESLSSKNSEYHPSSPKRMK